MVVTGNTGKCKVGCPSQDEFRRVDFSRVAAGLEKMRKEEIDLKSDQAIFLGIVRDMAVHISKKGEDPVSSENAVWRLCHEIGHEFGGLRR